jgi:ABC-type transporter Mla MlaB component
MGAPAQRSVGFVIRGPITRADIPALCDRVFALLQESGADIVVCDVEGVECDAVTVDAMARLQLAARKTGRRIQLRGACPDLLALVNLMGLREVLPPA